MSYDASEWEAGDVARVIYGDVDEVGIVRRREAAMGSLEFAYLSGGYDMVAAVAQHARRLVVIDPEDAEQVERLRAALEARAFSAWACGAATCLSAALREFAAPPKVEEPTGLGAVVEDAHGVRWVLNYATESFPNWRSDRRRNACVAWRKWDAIQSPRILSPGVPTEATS